MRFSTTIFFTSTFLASHQALAAKAKSRSSCVAFVAEPPAYYTHGWGTPADEEAGTQRYRISKAIDCLDKTKPCQTVIAEGYVSEHPTLNITTDSPEAIFALIGHTRGERQYKIKSGITKVPPLYLPGESLVGFKGWITFSPNCVCTEGTLSSCTGDIANGTAIKACTPFQGAAAGIPHFTETDETILEYDLNCNPAMTPAARRGENPTDCLSDGEATNIKSDGDSLTSIDFSLLVAGLGLAASSV